MDRKIPKITIFLGIYNGEQYLGSLLKQLVSQSNQKFNLLIVDNNSSDNSLQVIKNWPRVFGQRLTLVKNPVNYGGHGSVFNNLRKIKTPWFCTFHQDDFYKPNHLETLLKLVSNSSPSTVGVCTTMGSMSSKGKYLNSKPRVTWFSSNLDQAGQFLQNIKSQAVPYPATAFNLEIYKKTRVPNHSTAFSDTEQTLKMLAYGTFTCSQSETMYYRENPSSESHVINQRERVLGAAVGLLRIFHSKEFEIILKKVPKNKRSIFTRQLLDAISSRIPESDLLETLKISAVEQMIEKWGYLEKDLISPSSDIYQKYRFLPQLDTIGDIQNSKISNDKKKSKSADDKIKLSAKVWDIYFNMNLGVFRKFNKLFIVNLYKIIFLVKPNHRFKNSW